MSYFMCKGFNGEAEKYRQLEEENRALKYSTDHILLEREELKARVDELEKENQELKQAIVNIALKI